MKRHLFNWRPRGGDPTTNAKLSKELAACARLARRDFPWLDRSVVGRAHVAIHCYIFALAQTGYFARGPCVDSLGCSEVCACLRVRCSSVAFVSCCDLHEESQTVDADRLCKCLGRLLPCRHYRRISPSVCCVARCFRKGCHDRRCWCDSWAVNWRGFCEEPFKKARENDRLAVICSHGIEDGATLLLAFFGDLMKLISREC